MANWRPIGGTPQPVPRVRLCPAPGSARCWRGPQPRAGPRGARPAPCREHWPDWPPILRPGHPERGVRADVDPHNPQAPTPSASSSSPAWRPSSPADAGTRAANPTRDSRSRRCARSSVTRTTGPSLTRTTGFPLPGTAALFVADRTGPGGTNFTPLRATSGDQGEPIGDTRIGGRFDARPPVPRVHAFQVRRVRNLRGLARRFPRLARRDGGGWLRPLGVARHGERWDHGSTLGRAPGRSNATSDAAGRLDRALLGTGSANWSAADSDRRYDVDSRDTAAMDRPAADDRSASPSRRIFACAGGRTQNDAGRTTWLLEAIPPGDPAERRPPEASQLIQDLLYGDDKWVRPPQRAPRTPPPPTPPTPNDQGTGRSERRMGSGAVRDGAGRGRSRHACELHMISCRQGPPRPTPWRAAGGQRPATTAPPSTASGPSQGGATSPRRLASTSARSRAPRSSPARPRSASSSSPRPAGATASGTRFASPTDPGDQRKTSSPCPATRPTGTVPRMTPTGWQPPNCPANGAERFGRRRPTETTVAIWAARFRTKCS